MQQLQAQRTNREEMNVVLSCGSLNEAFKFRHLIPIQFPVRMPRETDTSTWPGRNERQHDGCWFCAFAAKPLIRLSQDEKIIAERAVIAPQLDFDVRIF